MNDTITVTVSYRGWRSLWRWTEREVQVPVPAEMRPGYDTYHNSNAWGR